MAVKVNTQQGAQDVVIKKVGRFNVDVDTNHPLAGKTVTFEINILKVREATPPEKSPMATPTGLMVLTITTRSSLRIAGLADSILF